MMLSSPSKESPLLPKLKFDRQLAPCPVEEGDEA
jgi:hypothetical protein